MLGYDAASITYSSKIWKHETSLFTVCNVSSFLIGGSDYTSPGDVTLTFDNTTTSQAVRVVIVDDDIFEDDETFLGNLATTDPYVDLIPATATATILEDNDGKLFS